MSDQGRFLKVTRSTVRLHAPLKAVRLGPDARIQAQVDQELRASYEQGVRDGEKRLNEQLLKQRCELLELQKGVLHRLDTALARVRSECESALVDLACEAAKKLSGNLEITPAMVQQIVSDALTGLEDSHDITVLVSPEDLELLKGIHGMDCEPIPAGATSTCSPSTSPMRQGRVQFKPSPEVGRGGCLVQTRFGTLDVRRETRFEMLKRALNE